MSKAVDRSRTITMVNKPESAAMKRAFGKNQTGIVHKGYNQTSEWDLRCRYFLKDLRYKG